MEEKMNTDRFRFRVWDENRKIYPIPTDFLIDYDGNLWEQCTPIDNSDNHLIIEQCTGLKDKNGKLIYEGDVLLGNTKNFIIKIIYHKGQFAWMRIAGTAQLMYAEELSYYYSVIGNIHEYERKENE
jgi:hypothetical protein